MTGQYRLLVGANEKHLTMRRVIARPSRGRSHLRWFAVVHAGALTCRSRALRFAPDRRPCVRNVEVVGSSPITSIRSGLPTQPTPSSGPRTRLVNPGSSFDVGWRSGCPPAATSGTAGLGAGISNRRWSVGQLLAGAVDEEGTPKPGRCRSLSTKASALRFLPGTGPQQSRRDVRTGPGCLGGGTTVPPAIGVPHQFRSSHPRPVPRGHWGLDLPFGSNP